MQTAIDDRSALRTKLKSALSDRDESHEVIGYLAAEIARVTGRDPNEIIGEAKSAIREMNIRIEPPR
jgi:hypothetical protein